MLPTKFRFIWPSEFRGEDLKKSANQKQEMPMAAMFVNGSWQNGQLYRGPSIDASYQVSLHLAKGFQRRRLKCEKLMEDRRRTPSGGKSSHCLCQGELKRIKEYHFNINCYCTGIVFLVQNICMCTHFKTSFLHIWE